MSGLPELVQMIDGSGSRAEFAEKAGISESYLSSILSGRKPFDRVPVETAIRISRISGIPIERLASNEAPGVVAG